MTPTFRAACLTLLALALPAAAADHRETRPVEDFTEVGLSAPVDVHVSLGAVPSLTFEGEAETIARLETVVESGRLKIRVKPGEKNWNWSRKPTRAIVVARRIDALAVAGSGDITASGMQGEALKVSIAGSGDVRVNGKVEGLTASIAGSGDIRASDLEAQRVKVTIAGSGDATVRARQALSVNVSGSGDVRYYGDPTIEKTILGSGSVRRASGPPT
jgi:hypothetical protein